MVHFVGAGPGAKDLITVRGKEYLEQADVIIYAGSLVNEDLLTYTKADCEIHNSAYMTLEQVIEVTQKAVEQQKMVVRLHTGDPAIFGAIREQMDELDRLGISYDVCPGVSSLFGAAAAIPCEYTLPAVSQSVIITRAKGRTDVPKGEELSDLAKHQATMVLFLSSSLAGDVQRDLLLGGYGEDTPVAVVYKATWPDEKVIRTDIAHFVEEMEKEQITKTALIIVGAVLGNTYEKSKLYDKTFTTEYRKASHTEE